MKCVLLAAAVATLACTMPLTAQTTTAASQKHTSPIANGRYEIIQSEVGGGRTFRLDRWSGRVSQSVVARDSTATWEEMRVEGSWQNANQGLARFQLTTSGREPNRTILLDVATGWCWYLVLSNVAGKDGAVRRDFVWQSFRN